MSGPIEMSLPTYHYHHAQHSDAGEHAAGLSAWDQCYEQLSAGCYQGRVEELCAGPVQVFRESACQSLLQSGVPRPGSLVLGLARTDSGGWFCGHRLEQLSAIEVDPGCEFEFVTTPDTQLTAVCIDEHALRAHAARVLGDAVAVRRTAALLQLPEAKRQGLLELLEAAMALGRVQAALLAQPELQRTLTQSLADLVLSCLDIGQVPERPAAGAAARRRIVRQARAYMQAHADALITVPDLCEATASSRRTLQYAFEDVLQMSPVSYLRAMRLNRVRRTLLTDDRASVGDVAARWGFWHLSRFAADYRALFGELPSATRTRRGIAGAAGAHGAQFTG